MIKRMNESVKYHLDMGRWIRFCCKTVVVDVDVFVGFTVVVVALVGISLLIVWSIIGIPSAWLALNNNVPRDFSRSEEIKPAAGLILECWYLRESAVRSFSECLGRSRRF